MHKAFLNRLKEETPNRNRPAMFESKLNNSAEIELRQLYRLLGVEADDLIDRIPDCEMAWVLKALTEEIGEKGFEAIAAKPRIARSGLEMLLEVM